jgi:Flp pilus assembly protein TadD
MTPADPNPHALLLGRLLVVACALLVAAWCLREDAQPDLYFHLAAGRWIFERGLPFTNEFLAPNPDYVFVNHEWLFQVAIWPVYLLGGVPLLQLVKTLGAALICACAVHASDRRGPWRWLLLAPALLLLGPRLMLRPEVFSFTGGALFLATLTHCRGRPSRRAIAGLVVFQLLWDNSHGFAMVGSGIAGAAWIACLVHRALGSRGERFGPPGDAKALGVLFAVSLAVGLLNPYGPKGSFYPVLLVWRAVAETGQAKIGYEIVEMISPFDPQIALRPEVIAFKYWTALAVPLGLHGLWRGRLRPETLAGCIVLWVASTPFVRTLPFAALALIPLTASGLSALQAQLGRRSPSAAGWITERIAPLAGAVAILAFALATAQGDHHANSDYDSRAGVRLAPLTVYEDAVAFLVDHPPPAELFNDFGSGHYLTWARFGQTPKPFMSGHIDLYPRRFHAYYQSLVTQAEGESPLQHAERLTQELERWGVSDIFLDHRLEGVPRTLVQALHVDPRWTLVFADPRAVIFRRAGSDGTPPLDVARLAAEAREHPFADELPLDFGLSRLLSWLGLGGRGLRPLERTHLARLLEDLGQPATALALGRSAARLSDGFPPVLATAASLERRHGDPAEARRHLASWKAQRPRDATPWLHEGQMELARGQARRAMTALRRARELDPASYPVHHQLLAACDLAGDPVALRRALAAVPAGLIRPALLDFYRGTAALEEDQTALASDALRRAVEAEPDHTEALSRLGEALSRGGELVDAERTYGRLCELTPANPVAWRNLGTVRYSRGEASGALEAWTRAAEVDVREIRSLVFAGQLAREMGDVPGALDWVRQALARDPQDAGARELLRLLED